MEQDTQQLTRVLESTVELAGLLSKRLAALESKATEHAAQQASFMLLLRAIAQSSPDRMQFAAATEHMAAQLVRAQPDATSGNGASTLERVREYLHWLTAAPNEA